jgi:4'-phosphopantetheinyl transferase
MLAETAAINLSPAQDSRVRSDVFRSETKSPRTPVRVWICSLIAHAGDAAELRALLSGDELERAHRFGNERDRARFIMGRGLLRVVLGKQLEVEPGALRFSYGPAGKPILCHDNNVHFNLSHSRDLICIALAPREIGIDIEYNNRAIDELGVAALAFNPDTVRRLIALEGPRRRAAFFVEWTRREALAKASGTGLLLRDSEAQVAIAYRVQMLQLASDYTAAVALRAT